MDLIAFSVKNLDEELIQQFDLEFRAISKGETYWKKISQAIHKETASNLDLAEFNWDDIKIKWKDLKTDEILDQIKLIQAKKEELEDDFYNLETLLAENVLGNEKTMEKVLNTIKRADKKRSWKKTIEGQVEKQIQEIYKKIKQENKDVTDFDLPQPS